MRENPEFQKQMKKLTESKDFKDSVKKTTEAMKDPNTAAKMEARAQHMIDVGNDQLKKAAGNSLEEAMASMANPQVMSEMAQMLKDPKTKQQLVEMMKDPSFKSYVDAVSSIDQYATKSETRRILTS